MSETTISVQGKGAIYVVPDVTRLEITIERVFPDSKSLCAGKGKLLLDCEDSRIQQEARQTCKDRKV